MKEQDIHSAVSTIMERLKGEGKSPKTLKTYKTSFNSFKKYLEDNKIKFVDESMCLEYIYLKTGQRFSSFACVTSNTRVDYRMRPLSLLIWRLTNNAGASSPVRLEVCMGNESPFLAWSFFCRKAFLLGCSTGIQKNQCTHPPISHSSIRMRICRQMNW